MVSSGGFRTRNPAFRSGLEGVGPNRPQSGRPLLRLRRKRPFCYTAGLIPGLRPYIMSVDAATVRRIAHLARIAVADAEVPHLQGELNAMLAFVEQLREVNVDGVEPMTSVMPMEMKKRPDLVNDGEIADEVVANAPETQDHFFLVPKVVE